MILITNNSGGGTGSVCPISQFSILIFFSSKSCCYIFYFYKRNLYFFTYCQVLFIDFYTLNNLYEKKTILYKKIDFYVCLGKSQSNAHHDKHRMFAPKQCVMSCCACEGYKIYNII